MVLITCLFWSLPILYLGRDACGGRGNWSGDTERRAYYTSSVTSPQGHTFIRYSPKLPTNISVSQDTLQVQDVTSHRRPKATRSVFIQGLIDRLLPLRQHHRDNQRQRALYKTTRSPLPLRKLPKSIRLGGICEFDHGRRESGH